MRVDAARRNQVVKPPVGPLLRGLRVVLAAILRGFAALGPTPTNLAGKVARRLPKTVWVRDRHVVARRLGLWFDLDLRDNVQRTLYFTGWYERRYLSLLESEIQSGDVFVDVGAHVGIHSLYLAKHLERLGGGHVVAFEPAPDVAARLQWAVARNGLRNIQVVEHALGSEPATATLKTDPDRYHESDGSVRSFYGPGDAAYVVPVTTLDAWLQANATKVDIVKVDVEGAELDALRGMERCLAEDGPRLIGVEIRGYLLTQAGVSHDEVPAFLRSLGYVPVPSPDLEGNFLFRRAGIGTDELPSESRGGAVDGCAAGVSTEVTTPAVG